MNKSNIKKMQKMQAECDAFNEKNPVGTEVFVKLDFVDELFRTKTRSKAQILSGHSVVIWLENVSGCYLLNCVSAVPDSPSVTLSAGEFGYIDQVTILEDVGYSFQLSDYRLPYWEFGNEGSNDFDSEDGAVQDAWRDAKERIMKATGYSMEDLDRMALDDLGALITKTLSAQKAVEPAP